MSAASPELEVAIEGMTCVACTRRVQKALERVDGVTAVEVDLVRERAVVRGRGVAISALAVAAEQAGYALRSTTSAAPRAVQPRGSQTAAAALVLAALATALPWVAPASVVRAGIELALGLVVVAVLGRELLVRAWDELRHALVSWTSEVGQLYRTVRTSAGSARVAKPPRTLRGDSLPSPPAPSTPVTLVASGGLGMSFLVSSGALGALGLHLAMLRELVEGTAMAHGSPHSEAASAATIVAFVLVGRALEARARHRVAEALDGLDVRATEAVRVLRHGVEGALPTSEIRRGDVVLVPPHTVVPADGTIEDGPAFIDEAHLTGESHAVERGPGAIVHAGTVNAARAFRLRVTSVGDDTRQAQIQKLVRNALSTKSATVEAAERWSARVVPAVLVVAAGTLVALLATGSGPTEALTRAVTVLVVACPCALGLATPTAFSAALGAGLRAGILVGSPARFELLALLHAIVLDKTGTLTAGQPRPSRIVVDASAAGTADQLLTWAAAVETESEHPLGRAIFEEAMRRKLVLPKVESVVHDRTGARGVIDGHTVEVTSMPVHEEDDAVRAERRAGASIALVRRDSERIGWIALVDGLRPEAKRVVEALRARGIAIWLLSGDHADAALARGREAGLSPEHIVGGLSPEEKRSRVHELERAGPVAMVGDGINDAPALASASVGVAIARGARLAVENAAVTIEEGLTRLVPAIDLSRRTRRVVRENLVMAFAYNIVAIPLAAFGVLDHLGAPYLDGGSIAALAMAGSSIAVVLSSLRLTAKVTVPGP